MRISITQKTRGTDSVRGGRARRAALILFTVTAVLYVGIQSRVAESIPTRSVQNLLSSSGDPAKVPPPEKRYLDFGSPAIVALPGVFEPPVLLLGDGPGSAPYVGEERSPANPLRAPPASL